MYNEIMARYVSINRELEEPLEENEVAINFLSDLYEKGKYIIKNNQYIQLRKMNDLKHTINGEKTGIFSRWFIEYSEATQGYKKSIFTNDFKSHNINKEVLKVYSKEIGFYRFLDKAEGYKLVDNSETAENIFECTYKKKIFSKNKEIRHSSRISVLYEEDNDDVKFNTRYFIDNVNISNKEKIIKLGNKWVIFKTGSKVWFISQLPAQ